MSAPGPIYDEYNSPSLYTVRSAEETSWGDAIADIEPRWIDTHSPGRGHSLLIYENDSTDKYTIYRRGLRFYDPPGGTATYAELQLDIRITRSNGNKNVTIPTTTWYLGVTDDSFSGGGGHGIGEDISNLTPVASITIDGYSFIAGEGGNEYNYDIYVDVTTAVQPYMSSYQIVFWPWENDCGSSWYAQSWGTVAKVGIQPQRLTIWE